MKSFCWFLIHLLLCDYYETLTDNYAKHENEEIFLLKIFQLNVLFLHI